MKILVADDDRIARKVLRALLEESGFEVETVEDGRQALAALLSMPDIHVAILDWLMPGMTGPEVCAKLRSARRKVRPYVVMLSAKTAREDIIAGLDAGADDFLSKPFNRGELLARLRVANRIVEYELEVQAHIEKLEEVTRRHQLLRELVTQPPEPATSAGPAAEVEAVAVAAGVAVLEADPGIALAEASSPTLDCPEIDQATLRALRELGLEAALWRGDPVTPASRRVTNSAWSGFLLRPSHQWMDLLFEATPAAVGALYEHALHRVPNISESRSFLAETLTIITSSFQTALRAKGVDTMAPYLSQIQRIDRTYQSPPLATTATVHSFDLMGTAFTLTVACQQRPVHAKLTRSLRLLDVLAAPYPPIGVVEVALLNQGTVLNERYIEKLRAFGDATAEAYPVQVFEPTPLAAFFNHGSRH